MNKLFFLFSLFFSISCVSSAQSVLNFADSIRKAYKIPELGYAVISSNNVIEVQTLGVRKINSSLAARVNDKFRIGSNTKAITGFIAAGLVKENKITWNTKFFDLYPELKSASNQAYHDLTLLNLLSFRTRLIKYTYTYAEPKEGRFKGSEDQQRYQFAQWFFAHKPAESKDSINFSNLGYVAAGLMLEKVTGKTYKELVKEFGKELAIDFDFGAPNSKDTLQPWGHFSDLTFEAPGDNYKLNWLLAAGNINVSLPDYLKFIQLQLQGLKGESKLLSKEEFNFLHFGLHRFSIGWFWLKNERNEMYSYNIGNPGTFLSKVYVFNATDKAFILLANVQSDEANEGLDVLFDFLKSKYNK
ncbi:MAG: beta-lactamase family protein [Bacteroidia bacterium]|nr:beta-lactamase family protein [Bacteroidia bacterium]